MTHDVMRTKKAIDAFTLARARQVVNHGYTSEKDDRLNANGELPHAAACYAAGYDNLGDFILWPWSEESWKPDETGTPEGRKRDIEKAGALLIAEWERLDRLQEKRSEEEVN